MDPYGLPPEYTVAQCGPAALWLTCPPRPPPDCFPSDDTHRLPVAHLGVAQMITAFDLVAAGYTETQLACHDLIAIDYSNVVPSAVSRTIDIGLIRALNPSIVILIYVNVAGLWEFPGRALANPVYGAWWSSLPDAFRMSSTEEDTIRIWDGPEEQDTMLLMNVTTYESGGRRYLEEATDYLVNDVLPAAGGLEMVDGFFIDNAWGSQSGISWMNSWFGVDLDSDHDGVADEAAMLDGGYRTAIRDFYADLRARILGVVLVGNHPYPSDLDLLDGRYGESNAGACHLNSVTCVMQNALARFAGELAGPAEPYSIINLADRDLDGPESSRFPIFTDEDAAAYAYLFSGVASVAYDDGLIHNTPRPLPSGYASLSELGAPSGGIDPSRHVFRRDYVGGMVAVNGRRQAVSVLLEPSGSVFTLEPAGGVVLHNVHLADVSIQIRACEYALFMSNGETILRLETDVLCESEECRDGWWSTHDGGVLVRPVPSEIEIPAGGGPYRINVETVAGWASDNEFGPTMGATQLTNIQPRPEGGTYFVFSVGDDCVIVDDGEYH